MGQSCPQRFPSMHLAALGSRLRNTKEALAYLTSTVRRMPRTRRGARCQLWQATASENQLGSRAKVSCHYPYSSLRVDFSSETGEIRVWPAHLRPGPLPLCKWGALHCSRQKPAQAGLLELRELTLVPKATSSCWDHRHWSHSSGCPCPCPSPVTL